MAKWLPSGFVMEPFQLLQFLAGTHFSSRFNVARPCCLALFRFRVASWEQNLPQAVRHRLLSPQVAVAA